MGQASRKTPLPGASWCGVFGRPALVVNRAEYPSAACHARTQLQLCSATGLRPPANFCQVLPFRHTHSQTCFRAPGYKRRSLLERTKHPHAHCRGKGKASVCRLDLYLSHWVLRPRFGGTFFYRHPRDTICGNVVGAGHSGPLVTLWKPLAPLRRGFSLRSSSPSHPLTPWGAARIVETPG